jgi:hypothetical protein
VGAVLSRTDGHKKNSDVFMQSTFHQDKTAYTAFDRMARRGNALVSISAAWPLLEHTTQAWTDKFISDINSLFSDLKIDAISIRKTSTIKENE